MLRPEWRGRERAIGGSGEAIKRTNAITLELQVLWQSRLIQDTGNGQKQLIIKVKKYVKEEDANKSKALANSWPRNF